MKLKVISLIATMAMVLTSLLEATEVEKLFDVKCAICHSKTKPQDFSKVLAPTIMGVMKHIKMSYPTKDKAIDFMVDYLLNPSKEKAICDPEKLEKFGIMPSQKNVSTKKELREISNWLFDNYPPKDFKGFGRHSSKGKKKGKH